MWYELTKLKCVSQEPRKNFQYHTEIFWVFPSECKKMHHFCNYQLTKHLSSQRYVRGKQREKCLIDFQRYPAELFLFMFYPLFQWVKSTCKIDPWNNKFIYTCVLDEIAVNFDIVLLWSSFESIFGIKKNIFCITNLVLMKKQTLMACICLGGILMKYAKMKGK